MTAMRRIRTEMFRYGESDFDAGYLNWGFHDKKTQIKEAESIMGIVNPQSSMKILDLACGRGAHAIYWADKGHDVTAVDISETFINEAKRGAKAKGVNIDFVVCDISHLDYKDEFDLVTWIEISFFNEQIVKEVRQFLHGGGYFIFDVRNPNHPKSKRVTSNWRTWREEDGKFYLERHETDQKTGIHEDVWITIDPEKEEIHEKYGSGEAISLEEKMEILRKAGFVDVGLRTIEGLVFSQGEEPYWLWMVGRK